MAYNGDDGEQQYTEDWGNQEYTEAEPSAEYQELVNSGVDEQVAKELDELFQAGECFCIIACQITGCDG